MFACIYGRSVSNSANSAFLGSEKSTALLDLAFTFSPLVEQTRDDTVVLDISGQDLLFGLEAKGLESSGANLETNSARNIANEIYRRGESLGLKINVAVAANPDASIHAARSFKGITFIPGNEELSALGSLSIKKLDSSLVAVEEKRAAEIQETFALWGIRTFSDLARLPLAGIAERMGQDGVRLQKLAEGKSDRNLKLVQPPIGFEQSIELEHPVSELEPLSFILSRLLNQLCANLHEYALATNELRLRLTTEPRGQWSVVSDQKEDAQCLERSLTLPVPMRNSKTLLRLLLFEMEREPPPAPIIKISISAEPVKPRASQNGLFIPLAPEPEKLEITLARLAKLVGVENVGSPEILDTHRPDAFRMKRFALSFNHRGHRGKHQRSGGHHSRLNPQSAIGNRKCVLGFRIFRPPWKAEVQTISGRPTRLSARHSESSSRVRGRIVCAAGPWRASGDWWRSDVWARDEWDVAVLDSTSNENEILCRIYRDLTSEQWFVEGVYD
jgi:protein ImuB